MTEIISPAPAARPDQACQLVCDALSDGDLDAAVTYYHPLAVIAPPDGPPVRGDVAIRELLRQAAATRMLYQVQVEQTLLADNTALVTGHWTVLGPGAAADGHTLGSGRFCSVLRCQPDGAWLILAEQMAHGDGPAGATASSGGPRVAAPLTDLVTRPARLNPEGTPHVPHQ